MTEEQFNTLDTRLGALESGLTQVVEALGRVQSSVADSRRDLRGLDEKLVRIEEALYYLAVKSLSPRESEELRSMLPDPPKRLSSLAR